jgi:DNA-binding PadR family transcriptional regulator
MAPDRFRRSPLALAILGVLEAGPLHPYGIQRRIKEWGKDQVVTVDARATLYKMIARLDEAGLIAVVGTGRNERYPERTTYAVTDAGRALAEDWIAEILSTVRNEFPQFPAALSFLPMLPPEVARDLLAQRLTALKNRLDDLDAELATEVAGHRLPRVTMLESEYQRAVAEAERAWVAGVVEDLGRGSLTWSRGELLAFAEASETARP